jgi:hypothetical protein
MSRIAKIAIVLLCFAMCGAAGFVASNPPVDPRKPQDRKAIPVQNPGADRRVWIVT